MWQDRLPGERGEGHSRARPNLRHWRRPLARLSLPVLVLAVAGAVVAASFGYQVVGMALGGAVVLALLVSTLLFYRHPGESRPPSWWQ
ncbi:MAG: hypothetical protein ACREN4_03975 [Candidatus Dormibacteria bacterium]